jgi:hypothetical protein
MAGKIHGLKSHDYHIIMKRLLPIMLRGYLDDDIWKALAELNYFYRQLCAKEIKKRYDGEVGERGIGAYIQIRKKYFLQGGSIRCNIFLLIFHMKLRLVALCSIGGCITLKGH